ncbi:MAG: cytochrome c oxidase subunit II [Bacteroidota bacterium]
MIQFLAVVGIVLFLVILFTILRILRLLNVARGTDRKYVSTGNRVNGILFMVFLVVMGALMVWYSVAEFDKYNIPIASEHGVVTDRLFWITMAVTGFIFVLTHILLFYFSYRYQYKETNRALFYPDNSKLEVIWTVIPAIVLSVLVFSGWKAWTDITAKAPDDSEVIEVMGYQFGWAIRYPGSDNQLGEYDYRLIDATNTAGIDFTDRASFDDFTSGTEIHVPKGKPVLFKIRARDVLHSVYVPEFRLKQDAVPGMPTRFWFEATKTTAEMREELDDPDFNYNIYCTEVCGRGHFSMRLRLIVDEPEEYQAWKDGKKTFLETNPDYLAKVPSDLKELAMVSAGIEEQDIVEID